jgi:hypothetical protein
MESSIGSIVWRGDADYYRRRLASAFTYDVILEMTCHSYVMALEHSPLLNLRNHASYLSTVFADVSFDQARRDMSRLIGEWLSEGFVMIPDEILVLAEAGHISLPFDIDAEVSRPSFAA